MAQETIDSHVPDDKADVHAAEAGTRMGEADTRVGTNEPSNAPDAVLAGGPAPPYHQVYSVLRRETDAGRWKSGDCLLTGRELGKFYGCSLVTVWHALDELAHEGQIYHIRGRGTFVSESSVECQLTELTSFMAEMAVRGLELRTVVSTQEVTESTPSTADRLGVASGLPVYSIERLRIAGDEPLLLKYVFLPEYLLPGLLSLDPGSSSSYTHLSQHFGVDFTSGRQTIQPALSSARGAALLGQEYSEPVLLIRLISRNADGRPIEYCHAVVKGSRAKYHIDIVRLRNVRKGNSALRPHHRPRAVDAASERVSRAQRLTTPFLPITSTSWSEHEETQ